MSDPHVISPSHSHEENAAESVDDAVHNSASELVKNIGDDLSASSSSGVTIVKPNGVKQPSNNVTSAGVTRIGRPCNNIPKPAIPRQNAARGETMASASSIRKISEELARKRISDLSSTDENPLSLYGSRRWSIDRKSSSGSVLSDSSRKSSSDDIRKKKSSDGNLSLDSYGEPWKFDNESRRTSDISVILTQDTDSFIIGDRVWVGGTKPGQIAYIGETQFAPGEWAGVVLDEPIGKNDGSVANIRYFQCEPKKGIFSRLTRLTRYPLLDGNSLEVTHPKTLPLDSGKNDSFSAKTVPRKVTPVPTPTTSASKTTFSKPSSPDSSIHPNVNVGDRVIVMSSQGSKAGVLRFLGATDFAPGEWCGVELDDPLGKNDGSVAGTRYFECRPKFGLFAPLHKVSKSPASRRPSQASCLIHRGGGSVGIRRQGSKESLASMSSIASTTTSMRSSSRKIGVRTPTTPTSTKNALQEILKEKELHIEQLLKERDLERAEVTRAASQADEAEKRLSAVQQEFEQGKEELEARIADLDAMVCLLKAENEELCGQLDDERKKNEDIQFRFEEVSIESSDLKSSIKSLEDKTSILEKNLADERKRVEVLELESTKLFEAEEQLVIAKDESESLRETLAETEKMKADYEQECVGMKSTITTLNAEIKLLKSEVESLRTKTSEDESKLRDTLAETMKNFEEARSELLDKQSELNKIQKELENKDKSFAVRESRLLESNSMMVEEMQGKHKSEVDEISQRYEEFKINSQTKLELMEEKLNEKVKKCNELEMQVQEYNLKLAKATSDILTAEEKRRDAEEKLKSELVQNQETILKINTDLSNEREKSEKYEKMLGELNNLVKASEEKLRLYSESSEQQLQALQDTLNAQRNEFEKGKNEAMNEMDGLNKLKESLKSENDALSSKVKELETILKEKDLKIEKLYAEIVNIQKEQETILCKQKEEFESDKKKIDMKVMQLENLQERQIKDIDLLKKELLEVSSQLKTREEELQNEKILKETLQGKLDATEDSHRLLTKEKEVLLQEAGDSNRKLQSFEEKLSLIMKQKEKLENDLASFISSSNDSSTQMSKLNEEVRLKEKEIDSLREELTKRIEVFNRTDQEHKQILSSKENEFISKEKAFITKENELLEELKKKGKDLENAQNIKLIMENELKDQLHSYTQVMEEKCKRYEEEIKDLTEKGKANDAKHEESLKDMKKSLEEHEKQLKNAEMRVKEVEGELKSKEEYHKRENNKLVTEIETLKSARAEMMQGLADKAKEESEKQRSENIRLNQELEQTKAKLETVLRVGDEVRNEIAQLKEEKLKLENSVAILEESARESGFKKAEVDSYASGLENENKVLKDTLTELREEKWAMEKGVTEKEMLIAELKTQIKSAEEWKKKIEAEMKVKNETVEQLEAKVKTTEQCRDKESTAKDKIIGSLKEEVISLKEDLQKLGSRNKAEVESVNDTVDGLKKELDIKITEITEIKKELVEVKERFSKTETELKDERTINDEVRRKLKEFENLNLELKNKIEEQKVLISKNKELNSQIEELTERLKDGEEAREMVKKSTAQNEVLSRNLEDSKFLLNEKEYLIKNLTNEVDTLKQERISLLNNNKVAVESLEKEKSQLLRKIDEMQMNNQEPQEKSVNSSEVEDGNKKFLEDREFTQGQVDFLNSVIVDMQKKNDALKARIEILEMGFSPEDVEGFTLESLKKPLVPPRLFCDICDVFDLHDTEDCPTQGMDQDDEPPIKSAKAAPPGPRPYCETCEVFGHDTADCDDGETF